MKYFRAVRPYAVVCFSLIALAIVGCWEKFTGPALRNGFSVPVHVEVTFSDHRSLDFDLEPGGTFLQRPPARQPTEIRVSTIDGNLLVQISEADIRAVNPRDEASVVLTVTPSGLQATIPPR